MPRLFDGLLRVDCCRWRIGAADPYSGGAAMVREMGGSMCPGGRALAIRRSSHSPYRDNAALPQK